MIGDPIISPLSDRPDNWSIYDEHVFANMTDYENIQRGDLSKDARDYAASWAKFRATFNKGVEYSNSIGGGRLRMDAGREQTLITIEQNQI